MCLLCRWRCGRSRWTVSGLVSAMSARAREPSPPSQTHSRASSDTHTHTHTTVTPIFIDELSVTNMTDISSKQDIAYTDWAFVFVCQLLSSTGDQLFDLYNLPRKDVTNMTDNYFNVFLALHRFLFPPSLEFSHVHKCWSEYNSSHDALLLKHSTSTSGEQTSTITRDDQHRGKQQPPFISTLSLFAV